MPMNVMKVSFKRYIRQSRHPTLLNMDSDWRNVRMIYSLTCKLRFMKACPRQDMKGRMKLLKVPSNRGSLTDRICWIVYCWKCKVIRKNGLDSHWLRIRRMGFVCIGMNHNCICMSINCWHISLVLYCILIRRRMPNHGQSILKIFMGVHMKLSSHRGTFYFTSPLNVFMEDQRRSMEVGIPVSLFITIQKKVGLKDHMKTRHISPYHRFGMKNHHLRHPWIVQSQN